MTRTAEWLGWKGALPDGNAHLFRTSPVGEEAATVPLALQSEVKKIHKHPVFDQGPRGSCTGQAYGVHHALERKVTPRSAMFGYAEARKIIGELNADNGAYIHDVFHVGHKLGIPRDDLWEDTQENLHLDPHDKADRDAIKRSVRGYARLEDGEDMRKCLISGHTFVFGFAVHGSFYSSSAGVAKHGIYNGVQGRDPFYGGHAVLAYGHDDEFRNSGWAKWAIAMGLSPAAIPESVYFCRNSWSMQWGNVGNFVLPTSMVETGMFAGSAMTARFSRSR